MNCPTCNEVDMERLMVKWIGVPTTNVHRCSRCGTTTTDDGVISVPTIVEHLINIQNILDRK